MPNKVEKLRSIPRRAMQSGIVYLTKPGKKGTTKSFAVRPFQVRRLCEWLKLHADAYKDVCIDMAPDFGRADWADPRRADEVVMLEFPLIEPLEQSEIVEDTGPAPRQNAAAEEDDFDTSSGFCAVLPAPDVQASIDSALSHAAASTRGEAVDTREKIV